MNAQRGFAIVTAVFLVVALATLGAFMLSLSNTQHLTSGLDIQSSRSYWAAKSGIQWAAAASVGGGGTFCPGPGTATASLTLDGFSVSIVCTPYTYTEGSATETVYWVSSTATSGGGVGAIDHTEREVDAYIEF